MDDSIILTGSCARGTSSKSSDVDFMVISQYVNHFHTETVWFNGEETQIILLPRYKIYKMILEKSFRDNAVLISMMKSCMVIADRTGYANKLSNYVDTHSSHPGEHTVVAHINALRNRCSDLKNAKDELEIALLVSTIMVLLSHILSYNFISGAKHCIRSLAKSHKRDVVLSAYKEYIQSASFSPILELAENTIRQFYQNNLTTGYSLNNLSETDPIIMFMPGKTLSDKGVDKIVQRLMGILSDCNMHVFLQEKLQALDAGVYIFVENENIPASLICRRLYEFDRTIAISRMSLGIDLVFPYYTTFGTGAYFGGKENLSQLSPIFAEIWREFWNRQSSTAIVHESYSLACGLDLLILVGSYYGGKHINLIMQMMTDILLPDVVDPDGMYNVTQSEYLRQAIMNDFSLRYEQQKSNFEEDVSLIKSDQIKELRRMNAVILELLGLLEKIPPGDISYDDIYPFQVESKDLLVMEVCLHCLSIFQLSQQQKFGLVFNMSRCVENV